MQRYFLANEQLTESNALILGDDAHHISRVMRGKIGDEIIVCNEEGICYAAKLKQLGEEVTAELVSKLDKETEMPVAVTIAQGLPKGDKLEMVLQKGTECGAMAFLPVAMDRSVVKLDPKKAAKKVERWQKIAKEAAEQAHRQQVPRVYGVASFKEMLAIGADYDVKLFAYEETAKHGELSQLKASLNQVVHGQKILVVVGPEGGISEKEADALTAAGFLPCALGPRILRTETAPLYLLGAISYATEL